MTDYSKYTPSEFIDLIDEKFEEHVGQIKRIDIKWGTWSREMNLAIRAQTESSGDKVTLGLVFGYWVVVSQLLDLIYDCKGLRRFLLEKRIKNKTQEAIDIRKAVIESS